MWKAQNTLSALSKRTLILLSVSRNWRNCTWMVCHTHECTVESMSDWWAKMFVYLCLFQCIVILYAANTQKKWYTCPSLFHRKDRTAFQKLRRKSGEVVFFEGKTIREVCCHCCGPKSFVFLDKINQYFYCTHCWLILTTLVLQISWSFFFFFWGGSFAILALLYSTERTRQPTRSFAERVGRLYFLKGKQ